MEFERISTTLAEIESCFAINVSILRTKLLETHEALRVVQSPHFEEIYSTPSLPSIPSILPPPPPPSSPINLAGCSMTLLDPEQPCNPQRDRACDGLPSEFEPEIRFWSEMSAIYSSTSEDGKRRPRKSEVFCVCRRAAAGDMLCCDDCDEWFHFACVGISAPAPEQQWTCAACKRRQRKRKRQRQC